MYIIIHNLYHEHNSNVKREKVSAQRKKAKKRRKEQWKVLKKSKLNSLFNNK